MSEIDIGVPTNFRELVEGYLRWQALNAHGVDNWEGYSDAMRMAENNIDYVDITTPIDDYVFIDKEDLEKIIK